MSRLQQLREMLTGLPRSPLPETITRPNPYAAKRPKIALVKSRPAGSTDGFDILLQQQARLYHLLSAAYVQAGYMLAQAKQQDAQLSDTFIQLQVKGVVSAVRAVQLQVGRVLGGS